MVLSEVLIIYEGEENRKIMGSIRSLKCRECHKEYEPQFRYVCEDCFGPLDVTYKELSISRHTFELREKTYWRYFELLPIAEKTGLPALQFQELRKQG